MKTKTKLILILNLSLVTCQFNMTNALDCIRNSRVIQKITNNKKIVAAVCAAGAFLYFIIKKRPHPSPSGHDHGHSKIINQDLIQEQQLQEEKYNNTESATETEKDNATLDLSSIMKSDSNSSLNSLDSSTRHYNSPVSLSLSITNRKPLVTDKPSVTEMYFSIDFEPPVYEVEYTENKDKKGQERISKAKKRRERDKKRKLYSQ